MRLKVNTILQGHVIDRLAELPDESANCCITSPPYWALRAYKTEPQDWGDWRGELGLEPAPELYIEHLMMVFDGVKRVLRKDGVLFVNIADTYGTHTSKRSGQFGTELSHDRNAPFTSKRPDVGLEKSLCAIPERFVLAMMAHGWIRRCTIIWAKAISYGPHQCPHCGKSLITETQAQKRLFDEEDEVETINHRKSGSTMPDSTKDRPNKNAFEYVYMFVKSKKYWYEQQYEEAQELNAERPRMGQGNQTIYQQKRKSRYDYPFGGAKDEQRREIGANVKTGMREPNPLGRTIRNVWAINPQAYKDAHFSTFPEKLVEPLIKMGTPEFVCKKCGKARVKILKPSPEYAKNLGGKGFADKNWMESGGGSTKGQNYPSLVPDYQVVGLTDCGCNAGFCPGVTLDPFSAAARPPKSPQDLEGTGLALSFKRSISRWQISA